ncbi:MAG TPA: hypothetical protein DCP71_12805, partial [Verrucomicrobiales bacterium]|nr:hypothetical protein [Verrucomicrobiales bacterium]
MKRACLILLGLCLGTLVQAEPLIVRDTAALKAAVAGLKAGAVLKIPPGVYPGGWHVNGVVKFTIVALHPPSPPHFKGGAQGGEFFAST